MHRIQRESCCERELSSAVYLAAMIDRKARDHAASAVGRRDVPTDARHSVQRPDVSALIWVEGDPEPGDGLTPNRHRAMIVVAYQAGQGSRQGSVIISYPFNSDDDEPHVDAISSKLGAMGWSLLASRCGRTSAGHVNSATLTRSDYCGLHHRLWLAESGSAEPRPAVHAGVMSSGLSVALAADRLHAVKALGQLEAR